MCLLYAFMCLISFYFFSCEKGCVVHFIEREYGYEWSADWGKLVATLGLKHSLYFPIVFPQSIFFLPQLVVFNHMWCLFNVHTHIRIHIHMCEHNESQASFKARSLLLMKTKHFLFPSSGLRLGQTIATYQFSGTQHKMSSNSDGYKTSLLVVKTH